MTLQDGIAWAASEAQTLGCWDPCVPVVDVAPRPCKPREKKGCIQEVPGGMSNPHMTGESTE